MNEYRLSFEAISHLSVEELSKTFYEAFDGLLAERAGQIIVIVYTEGSTAIEASHTAISLLEQLDMNICHVDLDLVDGPEISSRAGVSRQTVHNWAVGTRRSGFPRPVGSPGGKRIWAWGDVVDWLRANQNSTESPGLTRDEAALVDAYLAERRRRVSNPRWPAQPGSSKSPVGSAEGVGHVHAPVTFLTGA